MLQLQPIIIRTAQSITAIHIATLIDAYCRVYTSNPHSRIKQIGTTVAMGYVLYPIELLFLEQLNTKDTATPQATPNNTLSRSGTILSKASALSHFSTYGEFVPTPGECVSHFVFLSAESDDYAEVSEAQNGIID